MGEFNFQLTNDISIFSLVLLVLLGGCLIVSLRVLARYKALSKSVFKLQNELLALNSGQLGMGRVIRKVSENIAHVESNQQQTHHHGTSERVYAQAGLLLSRGATIEEVVESCEIAAAEAELIAIMSHSAPSYQHAQSNVVKNQKPASQTLRRSPRHHSNSKLFNQLTPEPKMV